jgi:hypothetical protein
MSKVTGDTARIWLWLLKEGGRHAAVEVANGCELLDTAAAFTLLRSMTEYGSAMRWQVEGKRGSRYGVTPGCRVPQGVTVRELMDAVMSEEPA